MVSAPAPGFANDNPTDAAWAPPDRAIIEKIEFVLRIMRDEIRTDIFAEQLEQFAQGPTALSLCARSGLLALGAVVDDLRLSTLSRDEDANTSGMPLVSPVVLSSLAGAIGETQLRAAYLLNEFPDNADSCTVSMLALDGVGLRQQALKYLVETVIEDSL